MDQKYAHILHRPHPVSRTRPQLSASQRAAQFAPFAALTGFEAVIQETARQTQQQIYLDESEKEKIGRQLQRIKAEIRRHPMVFVRYFVPDEKKDGGSYRSARKRVVKIDEALQKIRLESGETVLFSNIIQLFVE